jgi:hypothetical protein
MNFDFNRIQGKNRFADDVMRSIRMNVTNHPDKTGVHPITWRELWARSNRPGNGPGDDRPVSSSRDLELAESFGLRFYIHVQPAKAAWDRMAA